MLATFNLDVNFFVTFFFLAFAADSAISSPVSGTFFVAVIQ